MLEESFLQQTRVLPALGCSSRVDLLGCSPRPCLLQELAVEILA